MMTPRRSYRRLALASFGALALAFLLAACGGGPPASTMPPASQVVAGRVVLPAGYGLDLATLMATTPVGSYPVGANGTFTVDVFAGADTEISVETADGVLVLLGVSQGASVDVSLESTAEALLYYLVGGMWLPADRQTELRALLRGHGGTVPLAAELTRQLLAGGNGLADPDAELLAALEALHQALFEDVATAALAAEAVAAAPGAWAEAGFAIAPSEVDGTSILIDPSGATQSGVQVLHNPAGAGVVAQNAFRRPAALLAYEVAWENADGVETPIDPPVPAGRVDVPATGQLEALNAIFDVLTGDAPWSPVLSPHLGLAGLPDASRTHYQLVLLGPTTSASVPPIMVDARFAGFHDEWDDIVMEKSLELFLDELLLPLVEMYGFGSLARYDASKLTQMRTRVRIIADEHLLGLGVYLRAGRSGYADALRFAITRLVESREFRLELMDTITEALIESDRNRAGVQAMERRLSARASASGIAAAVQTMMIGGDVAKVMLDLSDSTAGEDWTAISAQALFALAPGQAVVSRDSPSATFTVLPKTKGQLTGTYLYRWTTSGNHGTISDLLSDGTAIDTDSSEIWYFHDWPTDIQDDDVDQVVVEVYEVAVGASSIPAGAEPVARMTASVRGDARLIDPRIKIHYGSMHPDVYGRAYGCTIMVLRFDAVAGADTYTVRIRGVGGQGDSRSTNQWFRVDGPDRDIFIDPDARSGGGIHETGHAAPYVAACRWMRGGHYTLPPHTSSVRYDAKEDQFVVHLFGMIQGGTYSLPSGVALALWYKWIEDATFAVIVHR